MAPTLGLVIPAYQPDIEQLSTYVDALIGGLGPETVRIELDAASEQIVDQLADLPAEVSAVPYRRGKGAAITAGFEALDTDVFAFADADGATPAPELVRVVEAVQTGSADLAVGSRRHPESTVATHQTFARRRLGDTFAWLARRLLAVDLHDYQCGAKALTRSAWRQIRGHLYEPGFAWDIELIAMAGAMGLSVEEVPIEWHDRPNSTVSPVRDSFRLARALFGARHRAKQVSDNPLHTAIAQRRDQPTALVEDE
ncbi:Glycosyl transferase family 2 [Halovenus aranensis]|jgi:glycosyltransferase involved in cell wall biosynthesis|uniref:Glycosyl transferase family 2 n=1 Tax=Halovenus aranensis TaxID=890420 RepID=A0A1G8RXU3_9EURY|nr:glycosyltransferase [Halovenus aranensis]SDJ21814.1 Glycosyl transferase family 2 [Halovenus aranensis]